MDRDAALAVIFDAVDVVNRQLPPAKRLARRPDAVLVGAGGSLDSLAIVNFVHALEQKLEDATGRPVALLNGDLFTEDGPFRTVETLSLFLAALPGDRS